MLLFILRTTLVVVNGQPVALAGFSTCASLAPCRGLPASYLDVLALRVTRLGRLPKEGGLPDEGGLITSQKLCP